MKNLLLLLVFFVTTATAQKTKEVYFKATSTEMYILNNDKEWDLHQKNGTTNITMVLEEEFLSIHAQKPSVYKIYKTNSEPFKTENLSGTRYRAKELKSEEYCTIDILKVRSSDLYIISIITEKYNLRYFVNVSDE